MKEIERQSATARNARRNAATASALPVGSAPESSPPAGGPAPGGGAVSEFITSLDPAFRAEELSYAVSLIARQVDCLFVEAVAQLGPPLSQQRVQDLGLLDVCFTVGRHRDDSSPVVADVR